MNRYLTFFSLSLIAAMAITGCTGGSKEGASSSGKKITVYLMPKQKGAPYFTSCAEGAQEAADELKDVDLKYEGSESGSAQEASELIKQWSMKGADVIAVSPSDPQIVAKAMADARKKGVKVITWDADADKENREFFVNQATSKEIGYALVDTIVKDIGGKAEGEVAIVTAKMTDANQNEWIKYIKEQIGEKYPKLNLVAIKESDDQQEKGKSAAADLMNAYPNLKGIIAISAGACPGVAEAVVQAKKQGKVMITGLALPTDMANYVNSGVVKSIILWDTKKLGYLTVYVARAVKNGELKPGATTFKAGKLGELKVEGDNVLLGGVMVFTKENIGDFGPKGK